MKFLIWVLFIVCAVLLGSMGGTMHQTTDQNGFHTMEADTLPGVSVASLELATALEPFPCAVIGAGCDLEIQVYLTDRGETKQKNTAGAYAHDLTITRRLWRT